MKRRKVKKMLKKFNICVVSFPDWMGGNSCGICSEDYQTDDFEYIEWEGTIGALLKENPSFTESCEICHEPRKEWQVSGWALAQRWLKKQMSGLYTPWLI